MCCAYDSAVVKAKQPHGQGAWPAATRHRLSLLSQLSVTACTCREGRVPALCQTPCISQIKCMGNMGAASGQAVEDMCLHRMADRLYGSLQRECDAHIGRQLASLAAAQTADPTIFLQQVALCQGL